MRKARCLSWRFSLRGFHPDDERAECQITPPFCPLLQVFKATDMLAVDEDLRHRPAPVMAPITRVRTLWSSGTSA